MTADERKSPEERERRVMAHADNIEKLMTESLAELRILIGLVRLENEGQEHPREQ